MSFDQEQSHVLSLHDAVVEIKATLNGTLIGIGVMMWARIDDRRKGLL